MKYTLFSLLLVLFVFSSCEKAFIEKGPDGDNKLEVFDQLWDIFNKKYAMFDLKGVDWNALKVSERAKINDNTTNDQLFEILADMVLTLHDGHTSMEDLSRDSSKVYDILKGAPENYDIPQLKAHLTSLRKEEFISFMEDQSVYALLKGNIGYVAISSFNSEFPESEMNELLSHFKDTKGLIIDVRENTGGDPAAASLFAQHLTDKTVETGYERFKTGPGKNDFVDSPAFNKKAESGEIYTKPIMILTNGLCYSATTTFIYQTNPLDHVKFIGSRTGGGSGSVADGFLANGFKYALSVSEFIGSQGEHLDDGFDPDIEVWMDDTVEDKDEVLQRAIDELN